MAQKKRIAVFSCEAVQKHITHHEAFLLVEQQQAEWLERYKSIRLVDKRVAPQGSLDQWRAKPSGNLLGRMHLTKQERGLVGPMVMQLV